MKILRILLSFLLVCCLATSAQAAKTIHFEGSAAFRGKKVILTGELHGVKAGSKRPIVVLMHGCGGLVSVVKNALRSHARVLASSGFASLILDSFGPRNLGGTTVCSSITNLSSAQSYRLKDITDAISYFKTRKDIDTKNIFVMGQSNGGSVAIRAAQRLGIAAAVAYYPWCGALRGKSSSSPLLILSGAKDDWTPPERCRQFHNPSGNITTVVYPNAVHSFDLNIPVQKYIGYLVGGDKKATTDSRRRMVKFFKKHLR